jgi:hypothetical protein
LIFKADVTDRRRNRRHSRHREILRVVADDRSVARPCDDGSAVEEAARSGSPALKSAAPSHSTILASIAVRQLALASAPAAR